MNIYQAIEDEKAKLCTVVEGMFSRVDRLYRSMALSTMEHNLDDSTASYVDHLLDELVEMCDKLKYIHLSEAYAVKSIIYGQWTIEHNGKRINVSIGKLLKDDYPIKENYADEMDFIRKHYMQIIDLYDKRLGGQPNWE